jgi:uncharacterized membrane protein
MRITRLTALATASLTALVVAGTPAFGGSVTGHAGVPTFSAIGPVDSNVLSMSANGSILVGTHIFGGGAFRWTRAGGTQLLGDAGGQISVSRDGSAIVADAVFGGHTTAARWTGGASWVSLGRYPGSQGCPDLSNAYAVSNGGATVVGLGWQDCDATAFGWRSGTGMHSLGSLDGQASRGNDVSADGTVVVGWDDAPTGERRGARWVRGQEHLLATGSLYLGSAEAVTPDGFVVVGGEAGNGPVHKAAYRWTPTLGGQVLGLLPGGGPLSSASGLAVTDDGSVVVGFSGGARRDAFVWTRGAGMTKLQDYLVTLGVQGMDGWRLDTALAISADGTSVAGWGYRPDGRVQSWLVRNLPPFPGA